MRRTTSSDLDRIDLGVDSPFLDENTKGPPSMNDQLALFIRSLQPEKRVTHSKILLAMFASSPDLLADYINHKSKFKAAVKDESEWRSGICFPLPDRANAGLRIYSSRTMVVLMSSVLIESILPQPLTQALLTKWINSNDEIVSMSTSRVVTAALEKLQAAIMKLGNLHNDDSDQTVAKLKQLFLQRCPLISQLDAAAARAPKTNEALRFAFDSMPGHVFDGLS